MLSKADLEVLVEAVDAWTEKGLAGMLMGSLIGGLLTNDKAVAADLAKDEHRRYEDEKRVRMRRATIIKAELFRMIADMEETERAEAAQRSSQK